MKELDTALNILKENEVENQSIINFIEHNPIFSVEISGKSILVRGLSDQAWIYISSKNKDELKELVKKLTREDKYFAAIDDWMLPYITAGRKIVWEIKTGKYILPEKAEISVDSNNVKPIHAKDAKHIHKYSQYNQYLTPDYFRDRIYKGYSACIYEGKTPAAWVLTQDDSAISFLYVMKEYRNKGYANTVLLSLIEKIKRNGSLPYMYIESSHNDTISLASDLGFEKEKTVNWFSLS